MGGIRMVDVGAATLAVERSGEGAPVLLLGGTGEPPAAWEFSGLVGALEKAGREVIRYAARGIGPSTEPPLPWTIDDLADDAIALIEALALDRVSLVGYSLGGFTAEIVARRRPDLVRDAVLVASSGPVSPFLRAVYEAEAGLADEHGRIPALFTRVVTLVSSLSPEELRGSEGTAWWDLLGAQGDVWTSSDAELGQSQAGADWCRRGGTGHATWPAEVAVGLVAFEHDPYVTVQGAREAARFLGEARCVVVPGAAHAGLFTHSAATIAAILGLLS